MSEKAKSILYVFLLVCFIIGGIQSCAHKHDWADATCTEPRTCTICKKTEGDPLGHDWLDATCTSPKTCRRCNISQGYRADHTWAPATCTEPESCSVCGKRHHWYSLPLGHKWTDATCTTPRNCSRCGATEGGPVDHYSIQHLITIEPTCQAVGEGTFTCYYCRKVCTEIIPVIDHKAGNWQTIKEATPSTDGIRKRYCEMCGLEMASEQFKYLDLRGGGSSSNSNFNTYDNENQKNTSAAYVLNTSTMKFHRPSCRDVPRISPGNYATSNQSRIDLISSGYSACGHCSP